MPARITLTPFELELTQRVGEARYEHATQSKRDPGLGPSKDRNGPEKDIRGARCEFAASVYLNLYWRPTIGNIGSKDVGGIVEVRSTVLVDGRLIIKPKDCETDVPFLLVYESAVGSYWMCGWAMSQAARHTPLRYHGDPAHYLDQDTLRSVLELRRFCHLKT